MEYYSAIKKVLIHATTRMNLKNIMMSEVRHERPRMYDKFMKCPEKAKTWVSGCLQTGVNCEWVRGPFLGDGNVLQLDHGDGCTHQ